MLEGDRSIASDAVVMDMALASPSLGQLMDIYGHVAKATAADVSRDERSSILGGHRPTLQPVVANMPGRGGQGKGTGEQGFRSDTACRYPASLRMADKEKGHASTRMV